MATGDRNKEYSLIRPVQGGSEEPFASLGKLQERLSRMDARTQKIVKLRSAQFWPGIIVVRSGETLRSDDPAVVVHSALGYDALQSTVTLEFDDVILSDEPRDGGKLYNGYLSLVPNARSQDMLMAQRQAISEHTGVALSNDFELEMPLAFVTTDDESAIHFLETSQDMLLEQVDVEPMRVAFAAARRLSEI